MQFQTQQTPEAIVMTPATAPTASIIWLHGLGADGADFVPLVPQLQLPVSIAPRFIFPHAPMRSVTVNGGMVMRAWYDIFGVGIRDREDDAGIRASAAAVAGLIGREQAAGIASQRIVLAGFSQGGAIALQAGLRQAQPLAGILALSTYLPLASSLASEAVAARTLPILMCHGTHDGIVPVGLARQSRDALVAQGYRPQLLEYPMQHQLCAPEVLAISQWLAQVLPAL
jgi:phospholipase/carboxylesterase